MSATAENPTHIWKERVGGGLFTSGTDVMWCGERFNGKAARKGRSVWVMWTKCPDCARAKKASKRR